ncbi:MAG: hypothetical protein ABJG78_14735 [Cyclobacteriaceae bacterium]
MKFEDKVAEVHLDAIINDFHNAFLEHKNKSREKPYVFDFTNVGYIANEELLTLWALFSYLVDTDFPFEVKFLKKGFTNLTKRKAKAIVGIWEEWKIYKITSDDNLNSYFDLSDGTIKRLKKTFKISSKEEVEIYHRHNVTPLIALPQIEGYNDKRIQKVLDDTVYNLNEATKEILRLNNCYLPFESKTLSTIISKELYENFLDHFDDSLFKVDDHTAFLSISLKKRFNPQYDSQEDIQSRLKRNFQTEALKELRSFYKESENIFKNRSVLEISFLDFGLGITESLKTEYLKNRTGSGPVRDNDILNYAFEYNSSRHPVTHRYLSSKENFSFTRGLFDVLAIVNRFKGVLIARSGYGRITYNFSDTQNFEDACKQFGDESSYFPGTLITIYFPEIDKQSLFDYSSIKPIEPSSKLKFNYNKSHVVNLHSIHKSLISKDNRKEDLYNNLLELIISNVNTANEGLIFFDFKDFEVDKRISRKIISFLVSDYRINNLNNVIAINPPPLDYLIQINDELSKLLITKKQFVIHPTPFIYYEEEVDDISIFWLGVFSENDIQRLNELLFEIHDLRLSDFDEANNVSGNVNYFDQYGNLHSVIERNSLLQVVKDNLNKSHQSKIQDTISETIIEIPNSIFLCSGNYYQYKYIKLFDVLANRDTCKELASSLFQEVLKTINEITNYKFISVTTSSEKIINKLFELGLISEEHIISLNNYHDFSNEDSFQDHIKAGDKVILICDVISTGYLTEAIEKELNSLGADLSHVGVIVNAIDEEFEAEKFDYSSLRKKLISLCPIPIKKFRREDIKDLLVSGKLEVIRIHPVTNSPILASKSQSNFSESVLLDDEKVFLDKVDPKNIKIGYFKFNGLIHPYFFDMDEILKDHSLSNPLIELLFDKLKSKNFKAKELDVLIYPRGSGIRNIDFDYLKDHILKNHKVQIIELERFATSNGWRFPHPGDALKDIIDHRNVLILDDGTCTGESIIQMIDEVAFLRANKLTILTIIGRINDSKRELFSRLDTLKGGLELNVYFGVHWSIPTYYLEESPISKERLILEALNELGNTPYEIRNLTKNILKELQLRSVDEKGSSYLVKKRDKTSINKDLVLAKQLVSRVSDYRFYKEYFKQFDEFIIQYESDKILKDRYKQIEDICIVFLHEPYFFLNVKRVVPDIVEKIEEFIITILFENPKKKGTLKLSTDDLYYAWTNKDLIHLFFTVFKGNSLFKLLNPEKLKRLIKDWGKSPSNLNYIFYRLLLYIPIKKDQISTKMHSSKVHELINFLEEDKSKIKGVNHIKRFSYFISSLPFDSEDFHSHVHLIKSNYGKVFDDAMHNEFIRDRKQLIITQLLIVEKRISQGVSYHEELSKIRDSWSLISMFLNELLQFSSTYLNFFIYPSNAPLELEGAKEYSKDEIIGNKINYDNLSLRQIKGLVEDMVYGTSSLSPSVLRRVLNHLFDKYIEKKSDYPVAFKNLYTSNFLEIFKETFKSRELDVSFDEIELAKIDHIQFPQVYFEKAMTEVNSNLRYADQQETISATIRYANDALVITIVNSKQGSNGLGESIGSGNGVEVLKRIKNFPIKSSYGIIADSESEFKQEFQFKTIAK